MARGTQEGTGKQYDNFIVKLVQKENNKDVPAFFSFRQKDDSGKYVEKDRGNFVSGVIKDMKISKESFEGKEYVSVKLRLVDETPETPESYLLDMNINNLSINIMNCLMGIDFSQTDAQGNAVDKELKLTLYVTKNKNGEDTSRVSVTYGGEKTSWKHEPKFLAEKVETVMAGKKEIKVYEERDGFLFAEMTALIESFNLKRGKLKDEQNSAEKQTSTAQEKREPTKSKPKQVEEPSTDDDLPF